MFTVRVFKTMKNTEEIYGQEIKVNVISFHNFNHQGPFYAML